MTGMSHNTPYQMQWNFNIQREIAPNTVATVGYIGSHNLHMFMQLDFNYPTPVWVRTEAAFITVRRHSAIRCRQSAAQPAMRQLCSLSEHDRCRRTMKALQTSLNRRFSQSTGKRRCPTRTRNRSTIVPAPTVWMAADWLLPQPILLPGLRHGLSNFNRTNNFRVSGIYTVPFKANGFIGQVVNGWQLTGVFTYLSGLPFSALSAINRVFAGTRLKHWPPQRRRGLRSVFVAIRHSTQWFNPSCFTLAAVRHLRQRRTGHDHRSESMEPGQFADSRTGGCRRSPSSFLLQFRAEAFNILNHPSFRFQPTTSSPGRPSTPAPARSRRPTARRGKSSWR